MDSQGLIGHVTDVEEDETGLRFTAQLEPEAFARLIYGTFGGLPPRRCWWHRFLIWLGFPHSGPYTHTFSSSIDSTSFGFPTSSKEDS